MPTTTERVIRTACALQMMLGSGSSVAVQDPSYPVYVDSSVIMGMTGDYNHEATNFGNVQYMPCTPDNGFFPDISVVSPQVTFEIRHIPDSIGQIWTVTHPFFCCCGKHLRLLADLSR